MKEKEKFFEIVNKMPKKKKKKKNFNYLKVVF